jgi:hypothetical protein
MTMMKKLLTLCALCSFALACGGSKEVSEIEGEDLPEWFLNQPALCGVGVQKVRGNIGSAKSFAESNAREDLSRQLETKVKSMIKQYNQEGGTEDGEISEELSTRATLSLTKQTLNGAVPKKHALKNKQFYSLVCIDSGALTKAIDQMKVLGEAQRRALARRAKEAHKELDEQMEKY